jgi:hypothetical protein
MDDAIENPEAVAKLEPSIRCVALVGYFLQVWATLESTLNRAIVDALDLTEIQGAIVTKNIQLRDKINILKTLIDLHGVEVKRYQKVLETIGSLSLDRNMMAHDVFFPDDQGDGVQFLVIKAKGKLSIPPTRWSVAQFFDKYLEIVKLSKEADDMATVLSRMALASLLRKRSGTTLGPLVLGLLNPLLRPSLEHPHSIQIPSTLETEDGSPPSPDQK